jgi:D-alanyl-D-alanine carboxypeptidase (penicillin-binding protein 5/6)
MSNKHRQHASRLFRIVSICLILLIIAGAVNFLRPLPAIKGVISSSVVTPPTILPAQVFAWPSGGEAAFGAIGYGVLATQSTQTPEPTASVAKLITALAVLQKYPLALGQQGPLLTLTASDVALYTQYEAEDGSTVVVQAGEQLTEYQALQAMLLPSANNIADSLAMWAFGSLASYQTYASQLVATLGLSDTHIGADASGFLPTTTSTANDLVHLGIIALKNPVIAQITAQAQANLPIAGVVYNVNRLLGTDGIIGIKTGNSDQAGGVYLFAAEDVLDATHTITIVGAVQDQTTLATALGAAVPLLNSIKTGFSLVSVVHAGQTVGAYRTPWKTTVNAVAENDVSTILWDNTAPTTHLGLRASKAPKPTGTTVGTLSIASATTTVSTPVQLSSALAKPPFLWRLLRFNW